MAPEAGISLELVALLCWQTAVEMRPSSARWNHNTYYHPLILDAIPPGSRRALDVGCGEGRLTRELRQVVPEVVGIDTDHASINAARANPDAGDVRYLDANALTYCFEPASFDLVAAIASLHHMDAETALARLRALLRPGGVIAVIGLARSSPGDLPIDIAAIVPNRIRRPGSDLAWPGHCRLRDSRRRMSGNRPGPDFRM